MSTVPRRFCIYVSFVVALSIVSVVATWGREPTQDYFVLTVFIVAALVSENLAVALPNGGSTSITYALLLATALLLGPSGVAVVAASSGFSVRDIQSRRPVWITLFNISQIVLVMVVASVMYETLGGVWLEGASIRHHPIAPLLLPLAALVLISTVLNDVFVTIGISLYTRTPFTGVWASGAAWLLPMQTALAAFGVALAYVTAIAPISFVLVVFPLILARQVYQQYLELKSAYPTSTRSLISALEVKDTYTRGHAERVARYSRMIGEKLGFPVGDLDRLELAALLHDIGKIAIERDILRKPLRLTHLERERIEEHPATGASILSGIAYLSDIVAVVRHHHERVDGCGYGAGLSREDIPIAARVLAVADAYDAMTSSRAYRPPVSHQEAVAEIVRCAGSQFDDEVVHAFCAIAMHLESARPDGQTDRGEVPDASEA